MRILSILCFVIVSLSAYANENAFVLFKDGKVANIYVSANEEAPVLRAVGDLQNDIEMVTGVKPKICHNPKELGENAIIISSLNNTEIKKRLKLDRLQEAKGLDKMSESYLLKTMDKPFKKTDKAIMVLGSDALGTVYGLYEISERIGVSPLYWWCDITPEKKDEVVLTDFYKLPKEPSVRYRGLFINDEEAMGQWSKRTSIDKSNGHPSPEVYKRVFELLVRLKANAIWPAMMNTSSYFFEFKDENGVSINAQNATEYGIYIGTSHCENMARNNLAEWHPWAEANADKYDAKGKPVFDYTVNPLAIEAYWQQRLDECKDFNMIYTIGLRGVSDAPLMCRNIENPTMQDKVDLLQKVINRQREMFKETFGAEDAVPQIFVPYEETGELYNGETKDGKEHFNGVVIPDDVTLVWTEDNYGFTRQLPTARDLKRSGGNGLYYHLAYQGGFTYDWLTSTPLPLVLEQLTKAYQAGDTKFWIVNVGDIKPAELNFQFYMSLANDIDSYNKETTKDFIAKHAKQHFSVEDETAAKVADILTDFHQLTAPLKPEFMTPLRYWDWTKANVYKYYSLFNFGDEAQIRIADYEDLEARAKKIYDALDESRKIPFYHLVYYPIRSTRLMLAKTTYYRKNHAYYVQGRYASVGAYQALCEEVEQKIQEDLKYYNKKIKNGKWDGIMDPYALYNLTERVFDAANIPNNFIFEKKYKADAVESIGAVCEGQITGDEEIVLQFSSFEDNSRFIDVFNRESNSNEWHIESNVDWLKMSKNKGEVLAEERIWLNVDWSKLTPGTKQAEVKVVGTNGYIKSFTVSANKYDFELKDKSYAEGNGFVTIEAEQYTQSSTGNNNSAWVEYPHYGYVGSSMFVKGGEKVKNNLKDASARLEYSVYFATTGTFYGELYRIPTLNEGKGKTSNLALGVDEGTPQVLSGIRHKGDNKKVVMSDGKPGYIGWSKNITAQMERHPFKITIDKVGYHTIKVYQVDTHIGFDRMVICTNEQAEKALRKSVLGHPQSYNTFGNFVASKQSSLPTFPANSLEISDYPQLSPMTEAKFNFAMYGTPKHDGYIPVNHKTPYDPNTSVFGWRASDISHIRYRHNEATYGYPFWQRDYFYGNKEARFYAKLKKGKYRLVMYFGDVSSIDKNIYSYRGMDFETSLSVNGIQVMDKEFIPEGNPFSRSIEIEIGEDEMLEMVLSDKWTISVLEIIPM